MKKSSQKTPKQKAHAEKAATPKVKPTPSKVSKPVALSTGEVIIVNQW